MRAARGLFAARGVGGVTTKEIADRADVAIGTLFLYAKTKAELLIMVQNEKFETAIEAGLAAARQHRTGTDKRRQSACSFVRSWSAFASRSKTAGSTSSSLSREIPTNPSGVPALF
ncbi:MULTISPECIES: helix-turn-helix domain-containing protein [unclassified Frondihabitans]|uniref:TetR/AcrR family transcriptional regulator n=1 Tax=unclassified Frondihabitans TaxID=2626248 RepID=UPI000F5045C7